MLLAGSAEKLTFHDARCSDGRYPHAVTNKQDHISGSAAVGSAQLQISRHGSLSARVPGLLRLLCTDTGAQGNSNELRQKAGRDFLEGRG